MSDSLAELGKQIRELQKQLAEMDRRIERVGVATGGSDSEIATPTGLAVGSPTSSSLTLTWNANSEANLVGYGIYRGGVLVATVLAPAVSYTNISLSAGTTYSYQIDAYNTLAIRSALTAVVTGTTSALTGYWVAPGVTVNTGAGTFASPWNYLDALQDGGQPAGTIIAGDTIFFKAGTYTISGADIFVDRVGTNELPIVFTNAPGAQVIFQKTDSSLIRLAGSYTWLKGDYTNGGYMRFTTNIAGARTTNWDTAIQLEGNNNRVAMCIVDNQGHPGIRNQNEATDSQIEGNIVFGNGRIDVTSPYDAAGNGIYSQNPVGGNRKYIKKNVSFANLTGCIKSYASSEVLNHHITFQGNVLFNAFSDRLFNVGSTQTSGAPISDIVIKDNCIWMWDETYADMTVELGDPGATGKGALHGYIEVSNNWWKGAGLGTNYRYGSPFRLWHFNQVEMHNNRFVGHSNINLCRPTSGYTWNITDNQWYFWNAHVTPFQFWLNADSGSGSDFLWNWEQWNNYYDTSEPATYQSSKPTGSWARLIPLQIYTNDIAFLVIYNWNSATTVPVNLADPSININGTQWMFAGESFRFWDVQNFFNDTKVTVTNYAGGAVNFDCTKTGFVTIRATTYIPGTAHIEHTPREFQVFIVERL